MRWIAFFIVSLLFLSVGISLTIFAPIIPVYYSGGGGFSVLTNGTVISGSTTPDDREILVPTIPNILHIRLNGKSELQVDLVSPNGIMLAKWQSTTINEEYVLSEVGLWTVYVSAAGTTRFESEIYTTAPLTAHPALIYASGLILLGSLSLLYSRHRRKLEPLFEDVLYEQNIGGRWIYAVWLPLLAFIANATNWIPSHPWLYSTLIVITVAAVFSCLSLAYNKLYVMKEGILLEAPFLCFTRYFKANQIFGYEITKQKKQRWFLLWRIPTIRKKKEPSIKMMLPNPLPTWLQILVLRTRFLDNTINFRPKSLEKFKTSMRATGIPQKETAQF
jgi:hypothetical protein